MKTPDTIQTEIIEDFSVLEGDLNMSVEYLIELGKGLPAMKEDLKTDDNLVKGCQSKVWLSASCQDNKIWFAADSNTVITKGLAALLIKIFSGQSSAVIIDTDLFFIEKIGMSRFIGTQRSNGMGAIAKQMKIYALAYQARDKVKSGS